MFGCSKNRYLIFALGNPGNEYEFTRHNVGRFFLNQFALNYRLVFNNKPKFFSKILDIDLNAFNDSFPKANVQLIMGVSSLYMNMNGISVTAISSFYKIPQENILILHDEMDINFGALKFKFGSGDGTHNGLKSVTSSLGAKKYWRLRIGIGRASKNSDIKNYVLSEFSSSELTKLKEISGFISDVIVEFVNQPNKDLLVQKVNSYVY